MGDKNSIIYQIIAEEGDLNRKNSKLRSCLESISFLTL